MNEPRVNVVEWAISELSAALKKSIEDAYGDVRALAEIRIHCAPT